MKWKRNETGQNAGQFIEKLESSHDLKEIYGGAEIGTRGQVIVHLVSPVSRQLRHSVKECVPVGGIKFEVQSCRYSLSYLQDLKDKIAQKIAAEEAVGNTSFRGMLGVDVGSNHVLYALMTADPPLWIQDHLRDEPVMIRRWVPDVD